MCYKQIERYVRMLLGALLICTAGAVGVAAQSAPPLLPIGGPRLSPPAIPQPGVIQGDQIYNDLLFPNLPEASQQADSMDNGSYQQHSGQGVGTANTALGEGITLYNSDHVCNDFNRRDAWASHSQTPSDVWSDHYAGWGAFAQNDGAFYNAANVVFSFEQTIGPGKQFGENQYAAKIASNQPYAAGFGSPLIAAPPGAQVIVRIKYMIFDHDTDGLDFDWVSLGLKPDATRLEATYVNGYVRGQWAELSHQVIAGDTGQIMILLQAQSPGALNSNIYFDDVVIAVNGQYLSDCIIGE